MIYNNESSQVSRFTIIWTILEFIEMGLEVIWNPIVYIMLQYHSVITATTIPLSTTHLLVIVMFIGVKVFRKINRPLWKVLNITSKTLKKKSKLPQKLQNFPDVRTSSASFPFPITAWDYGQDIVFCIREIFMTLRWASQHQIIFTSTLVE